MVGDVPILLQKSGRSSLGAKMRNNRIGTNGFLNQHCALAPDLESMLLARMRKIFLQQYLPKADISVDLDERRIDEIPVALRRNAGALDRDAPPAEVRSRPLDASSRGRLVAFSGVAFHDLWLRPRPTGMAHGRQS